MPLPILLPSILGVLGLIGLGGSVDYLERKIREEKSNHEILQGRSNILKTVQSGLQRILSSYSMFLGVPIKETPWMITDRIPNINEVDLKDLSEEITICSQLYNSNLKKYQAALKTYYALSQDTSKALLLLPSMRNEEEKFINAFQEYFQCLVKFSLQMMERREHLLGNKTPEMYERLFSIRDSFIAFEMSLDALSELVVQFPLQECLKFFNLKQYLSTVHDKLKKEFPDLQKTTVTNHSMFLTKEKHDPNYSIDQIMQLIQLINRHPEVTTPVRLGVIAHFIDYLQKKQDKRQKEVNVLKILKIGKERTISQETCSLDYVLKIIQRVSLFTETNVPQKVNNIPRFI